MNFFYSLYYIPQAPVAILPIGIMEMEKKKDLIFLTRAKYLIFLTLIDCEQNWFKIWLILLKSDFDIANLL